MGPMIRDLASVLRAPVAAIADVLGIVAVIAAGTLVIAGIWGALEWMFDADSASDSFRVPLWALAVLLAAIAVRDWLLAPVIRWCDAIHVGRGVTSLEESQNRRDLGYPE